MLRSRERGSGKQLCPWLGPVAIRAARRQLGSARWFLTSSKIRYHRRVYNSVTSTEQKTNLHPVADFKFPSAWEFEQVHIMHKRYKMHNPFAITVIVKIVQH